MNPGTPWQNYPPTYRTREIQSLATWIVAGASGSVVGLSGAGKSNLLSFLCHRPDVLTKLLPKQELPVILVPVDLNNLPSNTLSALYRVILRSCYENRARFTPDLQELINFLYMDIRRESDAFLPQSALREFLLTIQSQGHRVVFVLDKFDILCRMITPEMGDSLRGLRDSLHGTVSYIVGMRQEPAYLGKPEILGDLYRLLATHICYVGPFCEDDAQILIKRIMALSSDRPDKDECSQMLALSGGYPTLLKAICQWWLVTPERPPLNQWLSVLSSHFGIQTRLQDIWRGCTQEEQSALAELQRVTWNNQSERNTFERRYPTALQKLKEKGIVVKSAGGWTYFSTLFGEFVAQVRKSSRGRIWFDEASQTLYHGEEPIIGLTPKERELLEFLCQNPNQRHTYTELIISAWPEEERYNGVSNDSLHQIIHGLRQKVEPDPSKPAYVITWRGQPEGGYQFFPEGKPG